MPCLGRNRIAGIAAVLNVKLNGFTYVAQRFRAVVSLADASGQRRDAGNVASVFFLFQNDRITHRILLSLGDRPHFFQSSSRFIEAGYPAHANACSPVCARPRINA